jgi:hypothetical protein
MRIIFGLEALTKKGREINMKSPALVGKHGKIKYVHVYKPKTSIELRLEQISLGLPMNLVVTFLSSPPEIANCLFNLIACLFRDEKTTHHVSGNNLDNNIHENTSA